jgi:hypothetical protein
MFPSQLAPGSLGWSIDYRDPWFVFCMPLLCAYRRSARRHPRNVSIYLLLATVMLHLQIHGNSHGHPEDETLFVFSIVAHEHAESKYGGYESNYTSRM